MKLVLLDRDGVLNEDRADFVKAPGELVLVPGAAAAVARLTGAGIRVAVCTNQSCVGRGIITADRLELIHAHLRNLLAREGARVDAFFVCPHAPWDNCECRKPSPGLLREALRWFNADAAATPVRGALMPAPACVGRGAALSRQQPPFSEEPRFPQPRR